jgi:hypothetical protein
MFAWFRIMNARRKKMSRGRSFLNRLARALPVVLAAAPGIIQAVVQVRQALREPPREESAAP